MKDFVLNSGLSAFGFVAILIIAFADGGIAQQSASDTSNIVTLEKTVVTASRLQ